MKFLINDLRWTNCLSKEAGFVLVTVMLLLTILSISAFVAVEQSQFSYKANNARMAQIRARQISEDARLTAMTKLAALLEGNKLKIESLTSVHSLDNLKTEGLRHLSSMTQNNEKAEVYLKEFPVQLLKNGVSLSQNMAYSGMGMGLGTQGSFSVHYELRSKGISRSKGREVVFWTASDYRFIP